ncbi:hypothetical protein PAHAL_8G195300 [Panicum hallii]|jgi:hypothetical protein|uniref:Uncharacterized protein n=1 Tax=Panicum hallii TaxID=206008 RepID=A0A2T8I9I7_9POAL|nr:hypothetical protein PAHAL_8G195300 [Panicum hallii]
MIRMAPKVVISLLEVSKRSGGLLQALTCYSYYIHLKNSELQLILCKLFNDALVNLIYVLWLLVVLMNIYMLLYLWLGDVHDGLME